MCRVRRSTSPILLLHDNARPHTARATIDALETLKFEVFSHLPQDEICLKNRLRRRWQVARDPALKAAVNRLHRSVTRRLNEWRNDQWCATLESLHPEDQSLWRMTKRVMRVPTTSPPWSPRGNCSLRLRESRSPCRQSGDSVSDGDRSFGPGSY